MSAPQILYGLSNEDYHASEGESKSQLATMAVSPLNYFRMNRDPNRPARAETTGQRAGTLLHTLVLEPDTFPERYAIGPDVSRATKAWKEWEAELSRGITPIKPDEYQEALAQAKSLREHGEFAQLLAHGKAEVSIYWTDEDTGLRCRCRPDWMHETPDGWILPDVKTGPAAPHYFKSQVARLTYHGQAAFYSAGVEAATGKPVLGFVFGVVETTYPYLSGCYLLDDDSLAAGQRWYRRQLDRVAECESKGEWPGYEGVQLLSLPAWAMEDGEA